MNPQLAAVLSAMNQVLGELVSTLKAINKGTGRATSAIGNVTGISNFTTAVSRAGNRLTSDMFRIFGPLIAFGTLLSASTSGFSAFTGAIKVAATATGSLLLPVFAVFSAAILSFVDLITTPEMLGALESYFAMIIKESISLADSIKVTGAAVREFGIGLKAVLDWIQGKDPDAIKPEDKAVADMERSRIDAMMSQVSAELRANSNVKSYINYADGRTKIETKDGSAATDADFAAAKLATERLKALEAEKNAVGAEYAQEMARRAKGESPNQNWSTAPRTIEQLDRVVRGIPDAREARPPDDFVGPQIEATERAKREAESAKAAQNPFGASFRKNLGDVMQQMRFDNAPKPQSFSLAAVSRQAQLAALNQSPFEVRMQSMTQTIIGLMEKVIANQAGTRPLPVTAP